MIALSLALGLLAAEPPPAEPAPAAAPRLFTVLSSKSQVIFHIIHKLHQVEGVSKGAEGKARVLPDGTVQVQVQTKVGEFDSGNENRDSNVKAAVEAARYPLVEFKGLGTGVKLPEKGKVSFSLKGQLNFHGVTLPIEVPVTVGVEEGNHLSVEGTFPISLEAHKVERPELMLVKVDDKADIVFKLELLEKGK